MPIPAVKILFSFLLLFILLFPAVALGDYLVILKRGASFTIPDYWVDKEAVRFFMDGGKVGIPRDSVLYISEAAVKAPGLTRVVKTIKFGAGSEYFTEELKEEIKEREVFEEEAPVGQKTAGSDVFERILGEIALDQDLREKARDIQLERDAAREEFIRAKNAGDKKSQQAAGRKILELGEERVQLLDKVRERNGGEVPSWWGEMN